MWPRKAPKPEMAALLALYISATAVLCSKWRIFTNKFRGFTRAEIFVILRYFQ